MRDFSTRLFQDPVKVVVSGLTMYSKARRRRIRRNPRYIRPLAALIAKFGFMQAERRITLKDKFSKLFSLHNIKYDIKI